MKKTFKILVSALALAAVVSSFMLFASANSTAENTPKIISSNIRYEGDFAIALAVDAATVSGDSVKVSVWDWNGDHKGDFDGERQTIKVKGEEKDVYVVYTPGIAAGNMDKCYTYQATDAEGNTSAIGRISVAEYFYKRLFVNGIIDAEEGTSNFVRRDFYIYTLGFGAKAQNLLYNLDDDQTNNVTTFVTDLLYAYIPGYDFGEGYHTSLLDNNTTSIELPGTGYYNVTKFANGTFAKTVTESVAAGTEIVLDAHTIVTVGEAPLEMGKGEYYNNGDIAGNRFDYSNMNNIAIDGRGNSTIYELVNGQLVGTRDTTGVETPNEGYVKYVHNGFSGTENTPMFVYETDFMFDGYEADVNAGDRIGRFDFRFGNAGFLKMIEFYVKAVSVNNGVVTVAKFGEIELVAGKWYNIRFVYDKDTNEINYYRNGEHVATGAPQREVSNTAGRNWSCWYLETTTTMGVMNFDNTIASCFDANPPEGGEYYQNINISGTRLNDTNLFDSLIQLDATKGANANVEMKDGKLVYEATGTGGGYIRWNHTGKGDTTAPVLVFEADITIDNIAMGTATSGTFAYIYLAIDGTEYTIPIQFWSNQIYYRDKDGNVATVISGQKNNIRFEVDSATKTVDYYVNGLLIKENAAVSTGNRSNNWIRFAFSSGTSAGQFIIDNMFVGIIDNGTTE